ncbi:MAG: MBL fold metallo-hydrolase [Firmicutes bacterium]|nr:MBL fold metallo-hydrolase [Bacillota bacterium]
MKLKFCGGARTVTGSCFLLEAAGKKYLIDCGMFQGGRALRRRNFLDFPFDPAEIECLFLTHAHIDHSGLIPKLVRDGFKGKIYATRATADLCGIMLPDGGYIQEMEAEWENRKARRAGRSEKPPLYTVDDAHLSLQYFEGIGYNETVHLSPTFSFRLQNAGHILGSAIVELWVTEAGVSKKFVFSGDLGRTGQPIICDPDVIEEADFLIMESTYGQRLHEEEGEKEGALAEIINSSLKRGGNIVVPAFAVGRAQELLYILNKLIDRGEIPPLPIYIDSPMAIKTTDLFICHSECFDLEMRAYLIRGDCPLHYPEVTFSRTVEQSRAINERRGGALIISASGMCDAGRIRHHLKHNLWRPESTILFVGYQAIGSLGRRLQDGTRRVKLFGEDIAVRATIASIRGFSAHADREELLRWVGKFKRKPSQIILVHGEDEALESLAAALQEQFQIDVYIPSYLEEISLLPLGQKMEPSDELLARLKAQRIWNMWEEKIARFNNYLSSYLEEEKDLERLFSFEKRLQSLACRLEQEAEAMRALPLLFGPSQRERGGGGKGCLPLEGGGSVRKREKNSG